mmetsp:Transcript_88099/g.267186  ORF Transcript_88099/g.267186 Transcript_88099/m.267186 type:complete len:375 (-) Transcript_88099:474-1598(-)
MFGLASGGARGRGVRGTRAVQLRALVRVQREGRLLVAAAEVRERREASHVPAALGEAHQRERRPLLPPDPERSAAFRGARRGVAAGAAPLPPLLLPPLPAAPGIVMAPGHRARGGGVVTAPGHSGRGSGVRPASSGGVAAFQGGLALGRDPPDAVQVGNHLHVLGQPFLQGLQVRLQGVADVAGVLEQGHRLVVLEVVLAPSAAAVAGEALDIAKLLLDHFPELFLVLELGMLFLDRVLFEEQVTQQQLVRLLLLSPLDRIFGGAACGATRRGTLLLAEAAVRRRSGLPRQRPRGWDVHEQLFGGAALCVADGFFCGVLLKLLPLAHVEKLPLLLVQVLVVGVVVHEEREDGAVRVDVVQHAVADVGNLHAAHV